MYNDIYYEPLTDEEREELFETFANENDVSDDEKHNFEMDGILPDGVLSTLAKKAVEQFRLPESEIDTAPRAKKNALMLELQSAFYDILSYNDDDWQDMQRDIEGLSDAHITYMLSDGIDDYDFSSADDIDRYMSDIHDCMECDRPEYDVDRMDTYFEKIDQIGLYKNQLETTSREQKNKLIGELYEAASEALGRRHDGWEQDEDWTVNWGEKYAAKLSDEHVNDILNKGYLSRVNNQFDVLDVITEMEFYLAEDIEKAKEQERTHEPSPYVKRFLDNIDKRENSQYKNDDIDR